MNIAVSACLLGEPCRYDGASKPCDPVVALSQNPNHTIIPICPEMAGGLRVPRVPCEIATDERALRVVGVTGEDLTDEYLQGTQVTLEAVQQQGCQLAIMKSKSPACGSRRIYDGTFTRVVVPGYGVAARALRAAGMRVIDEALYASCVHQSEQQHPGASPAILASSSAECPQLHTDRLLLRALTLEDVPEVFRLAHDPVIGFEAGWQPHRTQADTRHFLYDEASAPHVFGIFEKTAQESVQGETDGVSSGSSTTADERLETQQCGPCVGCIGLTPDPHRRNVDGLMLGYWVGREAWGRGIATEAAREMLRYAFEELGLSLVSVTHYPQNARSRRVIEKCGFRREGVMRAAEPSTSGVQADLSLYSLTRDE